MPDMEVTERKNGYALLLLDHGGTVREYARVMERLLGKAADTGAAMVYSDYYSIEADGRKEDIPVNDYQEGSVRDDFDFGAVVAVKDTFLQRWHAERARAASSGPGLKYGNWYSLRLFLSRCGELLHLPETLYGMEKSDCRLHGERQFDYVDPRNREAQAEMEKIFTDHLRETGAWLPPRTKTIGDAAVLSGSMHVLASVVIPVLNRAATVGDALRSALSQKTDFPYNVIVVDNNSTDGTSGIIDDIAACDRRVVHVVPHSAGLGIGGCWNVGTGHPACGRYAVQLDSDDMYSGPDTLQRIVDVFRRERCAMVIGSYLMTDFDLRPIPPGIIDHREWTDGNGHNNALRINGLGAPRAFDTVALRAVGGFENVSYGEDYGVALRIVREYRICRIFDPLYFCRRWGGNSDAALSITQTNANNSYKDSLRTREILARRQMCQGL